MRLTDHVNVGPPTWWAFMNGKYCYKEQEPFHSICPDIKLAHNRPIQIAYI